MTLLKVTLFALLINGTSKAEICRAWYLSFKSLNFEFFKHKYAIVYFTTKTFDYWKVKIASISFNLFKVHIGQNVHPRYPLLQFFLGRRADANI